MWGATIFFFIIIYGKVWLCTELCRLLFQSWEVYLCVVCMYSRWRNFGTTPGILNLTDTISKHKNPLQPKIIIITTVLSWLKVMLNRINYVLLNDDSFGVSLIFSTHVTDTSAVTSNTRQ